jgi:hypothetical protein
LQTNRIALDTLLSKGVKVVFIGLLFLISATKLVSFQLDKAVMVLLIGFMLVEYILSKRTLEARSFFVLVFLSFLFLGTYLLNLPDSSLIIFFPLIGLFFVLLASGQDRILDTLYLALILHISVGIFFVFSSYLFGINSYVHPMYDKGLPFLHAAKGLTTTVQAYGTLLISWFLIFYWKKSQGELRFIDRIFFGIALLGLLVTFNRNTFLIFYIIIFFKHRRLFWITVIGAIGFYLTFFEFINKLIFNVNTLNSRVDLLQAFRIAFFEQTDWLGYLLGHGNNMVEDAIAKDTVYSTGYIENGTSVLLFTFGFFGYLIYLVAVIFFCVGFFLRRQAFYATIMIYIFLVAQQFTHEFFSTSIYLLLLTFVVIYQSSAKIEKENSLLSPAQ